MTKYQYAEALKDPRWKAKREEILKRDKYRCMDCGRAPEPPREPDPEEETEEECADPVILHVHHCKYEYGKQPWEYENETLRTLCAECHDVRHECEKDAADMLRLYMAKCTRHELYGIFGDIEFRNRHTSMHGIPRTPEEMKEMNDRHEFFYQFKKTAHDLAERMRL